MNLQSSLSATSDIKLGYHMIEAMPGVLCHASDTDYESCLTFSGSQIH